MQTYNNSVVLKFDNGTTGNADSGAPVTVRFTDVAAGAGALATIYDNQGIQILNPLTTDLNGNYTFKVDAGTYDIVIREGDANQHILQSVVIGTTQKTPTTYKNHKFEMIAHRGFKGVNPEHTMMAYTAAERWGADTLECDLQVTSDGVVVIFHDDTMDSKTNLTGSIASKTLAQVRAAIYDEVSAHPIYHNVKVVTLAEALEFCKQTNLKMSLEIKGIRSDADIALMLNQVTAAGMEDNVTWSSFSYDRILTLRTLTATAEVGFIGSTEDPLIYEDLFTGLANLGGPVCIVWSHTALINSPAIVTYAHNLGISILAYTLTSTTNVRKLLALGVTRIIANAPLKG